VGVRISTRCARPSADVTVNSSARKAGDETDGGLSNPPGLIVNLAGSRIFSWPPAGAVPLLPGVPGPGAVEVGIAPVEAGVLEAAVVLAPAGAVVAGVPPV
jgi:hypothetical protein